MPYPGQLCHGHAVPRALTCFRTCSSSALTALLVFAKSRTDVLWHGGASRWAAGRWLQLSSMQCHNPLHVIDSILSEHLEVSLGSSFFSVYIATNSSIANPSDGCTFELSPRAGVERWSNFATATAANVRVLPVPGGALIHTTRR